MQDTKRSILDQVARGVISPEQAAVELEELETEQASGSTAGAALPEADGERPRTSELSSVRIVSQMGSVVVIGDSSVRDVVAEGPHLARRDGQTMVIEGAHVNVHGSFHFGRVGLQVEDSRRLVVRMNPRLAFDADIQAGSLRVQGLMAPIRAAIRAGSASVEDCVGPYDIAVAAGSFKAHTKVATGESKIRCEAGSVKLQLTAGSSCRIRARTTMGKIALPDGHQGSSGFGDEAEVVIGEGTASLDIRSSMGSVSVGCDT